MTVMVISLSFTTLSAAGGAISGAVCIFLIGLVWCVSFIQMSHALNHPHVGDQPVLTPGLPLSSGFRSCDGRWRWKPLMALLVQVRRSGLVDHRSISSCIPSRRRGPGTGMPPVSSPRPTSWQSGYSAQRLTSAMRCRHEVGRIPKFRHGLVEPIPSGVGDCRFTVVLGAQGRYRGELWVDANARIRSRLLLRNLRVQLLPRDDIETTVRSSSYRLLLLRHRV